MKNVAIFIVGHITKEGIIAGPKALEHIVDVVLYLEGENYKNLKVLRAQKIALERQMKLHFLI